jgi:hypothetical protein
MFPEGNGFERRTLDLNDAETRWVSQTLARRIDARRYPYVVVRRGNDMLGVVFVLDVVGVFEGHHFGLDQRTTS